jgi:hypothetical protein
MSFIMHENDTPTSLGIVGVGGGIPHESGVTIIGQNRWSSQFFRDSSARYLSTRLAVIIVACQANKNCGLTHSECGDRRIQKHRFSQGDKIPRRPSKPLSQNESSIAFS